MKVRDADSSDLAALAEIRPPVALHRDRIRDAADGAFRYLVCVDEGGRILGHACLVFKLPKTWPPDLEPTPYPRVIDLMIDRRHRRQGVGRAFMAQMEAICGQMGAGHLHLSVDPEENAGALEFYRALGYTAAAGEPQWRRWSFRDSDGNLHHGEGPDLRMWKKIGDGTGQGSGRCTACR